MSGTTTSFRLQWRVKGATWYSETSLYASHRITAWSFTWTRMKATRPAWALEPRRTWSTSRFEPGQIVRDTVLIFRGEPGSEIDHGRVSIAPPCLPGSMDAAHKSSR